MTFTVSLSFTDTSLVLLTIIIGLSLYSKYFSGYTPLVHPLLLQKQSDVSQTRKQGESAIYRNWATGHGTPFSTSPSGAVKIAADVMQADTAINAQRFGCQISNSELLDQANDMLHNISILAPHLFSPKKSPSRPTHILSLLPTSLPLLQLHLARSLTNRLQLITLSLPIFLVSAIESDLHPRPSITFVQQDHVHGVLEQLVEKDDNGDHPECKALVVVVPEQDGTYRDNAELVSRASKMGIKVVRFEQLQRPCFKADEWERPAPNDVHSLAYLPRGRDNSNPHLVEITDQNLTAGMAACLSAFPASLRPTAQMKDTIQSCVDINEPFGLSLLFASLHSGTGFTYVEAGKATQNSKARPTIAFVRAKDLAVELDQVDRSASSSLFYTLARRQRLAALDEGYVSKSGWLENAVWKTARRGSALGNLRALVIVGDTPNPELTLKAHMLLSMPFTRMYIIPLSTGPILVSHFNDLQSEGLDGNMHSGAPASNVEVMLKGQDVEQIETGGDPTGQMFARGPAVLKDINLDVKDDRWTPVAKRATAWTNGTFALVS